MKDYAMKLLMLSALCISSVVTFSQTPDNNNLPDTLKSFKGNNSIILPKTFQDDQQKKYQNNLLGNKIGNVVTLPQDKMLCIVPDTNGISKIPNAWVTTSVPYTLQRGSIPNPALPKRQSNIPGNSLGSQVK
jgi:hypothetical protein